MERGKEDAAPGPTEKSVESVPLETEEGEQVIRTQNVGGDAEPDPDAPAQPPAPGSADA